MRLGRSVASAAVLVAATAGSVHAGDVSSGESRPIAIAAPAFDWSGFYAGVTGGAGLGHYDAMTSTDRGGYLNRASAAAVNADGYQRPRAAGTLAGLEGGYNWRSGNLLLGLEADLQAVRLKGSMGSGASPYPPSGPGFTFTVTSYGDADWLFTARPRLGIITPNNWLLYATGGLAVTRMHNDFSFVDDNFAEESGHFDKLKAGVAFGGGIEAPLTDRLSVKADYLHVAFGQTTGDVISNDLARQPFSHSADLKADILRAGLNYHFNAGGAPPRDPVFALKAPPVTAAPALSDWTVQAGARVWLSSGSVGAPQTLLNYPTPLTLTSRLIYDDVKAWSGETFMRADHTNGFFIKGNIAAGGIYNGTLIDEDFPGFGGAYSNTRSPLNGSLAYATFDIGYALLKTPDARLGPFVGYNYYGQHLNGIGCNQVAGDTTCAGIDPGVQVFSEDDHFHSLRVGVSLEAMLADRLKLTTDAAFVPWTSFGGLDTHLLRQLLIWESATGGNGVMLEAALDYYLTPAWSVGMGVRYWTWNTHTGTWFFNNAEATPVFYEPAIFSTERYGVFAQSTYRWGEPQAAGYASARPLSAPMNWTGFYVGGELGGGRSKARWSDPFGSTIVAGVGLTDVSGFGDITRATGALAGGAIGADWQTGAWVLGLEADAAAADFRGANTCYSGLGGVNCQHLINALGSATGRVGYSIDRTLPYLKAGAAWTNTRYDMYANTNGMISGAGSAALNSFGWTIGGGVEYALTGAWSAVAEYDHLDFGSKNVAFPSVAVIKTTALNVKQTVDLLKFGVNYRFNLASGVGGTPAH